MVPSHVPQPRRLPSRLLNLLVSVSLYLLQGNHADDASVFAAMLEDMDLGHKVAAMPGTKLLTYDADALGPVSDVMCIVSDLGVTSAYGLLREVSNDWRILLSECRWVDGYLFSFSLSRGPLMCVLSFGCSF